ncbi:PorP/SprF family type IX secretion system membrane protein [Mucilaginibacter ginkgonis]|uniref:Type IX secretion system membrane protein PorP/SprF n=1 Tax=Mucilaginibacter ginkgonis TaxID=2682091 RepID=A0A6I4I293_9SPHI|nr:type IX secretion system membrane protein PorP/SprF [Mucilaginibacter ginkgonis]QQL48908.1 type IX secretion system membrane protein PorP/SprF [Mucilaginibacter ginkgonis]
MNAVKLHLIFIGLLLRFSASAQQTVQFSQYVFNGLAVNPAYAGYRDDWRLDISSRLQWTSFDGAPKTNTISADGTLGNSKNVGLGILVTNDRLGPENNSALYLNYAYHIRLDDLDSKRLSFGVGAGLVQYRIDGSLLSASDMTDANIPTGISTKLLPDFRLGVYYYSSSFYAGASVLNLLPINNSNNVFINQARTMYLTTGLMLNISPLIDMKPSILIKEDFKGPTNLDAAAFLIFDKRFWLGGAYSTGVTIWKKSNLQSGLDKNDMATAILAYSLTERFRIGYSYDFATSKLATAQSGSHEISLSVTIARKRPVILSPRFF